jgi:hypothetical protein
VYSYCRCWSSGAATLFSFSPRHHISFHWCKFKSQLFNYSVKMLISVCLFTFCKTTCALDIYGIFYCQPVFNIVYHMNKELSYSPSGIGRTKIFPFFNTSKVKYLMRFSLLKPLKIAKCELFSAEVCINYFHLTIFS